MKDIVIKYQTTGNCEVDVKLVVKKWNKNFVISQWDEQYTLIHHSTKATNFTKSDLKVRISKQQAKEIIVELDLMPIQSPAFRSGKMWKLADQ